MKKFFNLLKTGANNFLYALVGVFYDYKERRIRVKSVGLNFLTGVLSYVLLVGFNSIVYGWNKKSVTELAGALALFLGATVVFYGTMLYSIYKGATAEEAKGLLEAGSKFTGQSLATAAQSALSTVQSTVLKPAPTVADDAKQKLAAGYTQGPPQ